MTHANGAAQSAYGFTGEMADVTGLTYLRARYYSPLEGRFTQVDPIKDGNNWYSYVRSNPINYFDPSGLRVEREGVEQGKFIYSCNCGWIDTGHAVPDTTNSILNLLRVTVSPPSWMNQERRVIELWMDTPGNWVTFLNLFVVKINLASNNKSLALGILMAHENIRESIQGWPVAREIGHSYFSEEDLTSDIIGYYLAVNDLPGLKKEDGPDGYSWVAPICKMPLNRQDAIEWSMNVFETYGDLVEEWEKWANSRLLCSSEINEICGDAPRAWPTEFSIDSAAKSGADWWQYANWSSFILKRSEENDRIYYMWP